MIKINKPVTGPDYKKIYTDILDFKYPDKKKQCARILSKETLSATDIIRINTIIFPNSSKKAFSVNQQHRSYDRDSITEILNYQKKYELNNTQVSKHFKISRNTLAAWKKKFSG